MPTIKKSVVLKMKYAIYQMDVIVADPVANRKKVRHWIEDLAVINKPDTILLPELWSTGYALHRLNELAEENGSITIPFLSNLAKKHQINIVGGSIANKKEKGVYNTSYIVNRAGELIYQYDKIHLVPMLDEPAFLQGGERQAEVFELDGITMGVVICYDLRFPELLRSLALQGAEVIHVVAQWPSARKSHWKYLLHARAIENQCYMMAVNSSGTCNGTRFAGDSMIISPSGEQNAIGPQEEEATIVSTIDLAKAGEIRRNIPVFDSRVPSLYGKG